ncbi:MAG: lysophospholipid acyltransferase family protein [Nitrospira sp.]|nr:lysophospholipid acyltransferase family protein [Nitrospira sp.]
MKKAFEYALVRFADLLFHALPRSWAIGLGEQLSLAVSHVIAKRRDLVLRNLALSFPDKSDAARARIAEEVWRNLGRLAVEFSRVSDFTGGSLDRSVDIEGREYVEAALKEGKGIVGLTAHFTNWELTGALVQRLYGNMTVIARPVRNTLIDRWVYEKRTASGLNIILPKDAVKASLKCLKNKGIIGMMIDQSLSSGGVFVEFFGRPASSTTLPALLHIRTGAPVMFAYLIRTGARFRLVFEPVVFPPVEDPAARIQVYTQVMATQFEQVIRRHPESWLWLHNRWKRQPD